MSAFGEGLERAQVDPTTITLSETHCEACGRRNSWGCGHDTGARRDAVIHEGTTAHRFGRCWHYDHRDCNPAECKLAGPWPQGYIPFTSHAQAARLAEADGFVDIGEDQRFSDLDDKPRDLYDLFSDDEISAMLDEPDEPDDGCQCGHPECGAC